MGENSGVRLKVEMGIWKYGGASNPVCTFAAEGALGINEVFVEG